MNVWTLIAAKATLAVLIALGAAAAARHARASLRHAIYVALFAFLLLLPFSPRLVPAIRVAVRMSAPAAASPVVTPAAAAPQPAATQPEPVAPGWRPSLFDLYLAGVMAMIAVLAAGIVRLRRLAADGNVWLDGTRLATDVACANGIRRAVLVVLSGEVRVPMTFGFRRQTIVLPAEAGDWDDDSLRRALRHELEHVRRDDWMVQLIARVACAVYWPHPLVWVAWRRFCVEAERTCDDAVVKAFEPATYAEQLVLLARSLTMRPRVPALSMASRSRLSERVRAILDPAQRRGPHGRAASVATAVAMAAGLALFGSVHLVAALAPPTEAVAAKPDDDDDLWHDAVEKAAEKGDIDRLQQLIDRGLDINHSFDGDGTALLIAAENGRLEAVKWLLLHGADPNVPSPGDGNPLIAASEQGHGDIVKVLLHRGARVNDVVPGDETALITAAAAGREKIVRLLISEGADVNLGVWADGDDTRPADWRTPLIMARRGGHDGVVKILLEAGAR